ncbi:hypothetical protein MMC14_000827 [Varicellaria rhodocarpa]|nr:hypothetical protein [Varicellaria rhodocarpa]
MDVDRDDAVFEDDQMDDISASHRTGDEEAEHEVDTEYAVEKERKRTTQEALYALSELQIYEEQQSQNDNSEFIKHFLNKYEVIVHKRMAAGSPELVEANKKYTEKEITEEQLVGIQRDATTALVKKELDHDVRPITNGENDRILFYHGFHEKLHGIDLVADIPHEDIRSTCPDFSILIKHVQMNLLEPLTLCTGNLGPISFTSGSYERIAQRLFNTLDYDTFFLEYDDERSGSFELLRFLPPTKNVVLGLVTTKTAKLESAEELKERIWQAADIIAAGQETTRDDALRRIAVSPQCGFSSASGAPGEGMTEEGQWAKMKLLADVAREVWG